MSRYLLLVALLFVPQLLEAQPVFIANAEPVWDARAVSLGHNGIVGSTSVNSLFINPSFLANLGSKEFSITGRGLMGSITNDDDYYDSYSADYTLHLKLPQFVFAMPIKLESENVTMVGALGYHTVMDYGYNYESERTVAGSNNSYTTETTSNGGYSTLSPGIGINIDKKWNLGLAINFPMMSKATYESESRFDDSTGPTTKTTNEYDSDLTGSYIVLGASGEVSTGFTLGFMYRGGLKLTEEGESKYTYEGGIDRREYKYKLEMPSIIGFGASFTMTPELLVFGEYQTRPFSDWEFDGESFELDNGSALKLGLEYSAGQIPLRLGYYSEAMPITDNEEDAETPKSFSGFTAGLGFVAGPSSKIDVFFDYGSLSIDDEDGNEIKYSSMKFGATYTQSF